MGDTEWPEETRMMGLSGLKRSLTISVSHLEQLGDSQTWSMNTWLMNRWTLTNSKDRAYA